MDLSITLKANYGPVSLGATKEAGPLGIARCSEMTVKSGGRISNAYGAVNEVECWGKRSPGVTTRVPWKDTQSASPSLITPITKIILVLARQGLWAVCREQLPLPSVKASGIR